MHRRQKKERKQFVELSFISTSRWQQVVDFVFMLVLGLITAAKLVTNPEYGHCTFSPEKEAWCYLTKLHDSKPSEGNDHSQSEWSTTVHHVANICA